MEPFDEIIKQFNLAIAGWSGTGLVLATRLFVILASIQIIWAGLLWMLNKNDPSGMMIDFIKKLMVIFFFWAILINYNAWFPTIINSFRSVGEQLSGTGGLKIYPSAIAKKGVKLSTLVLSSARADGWFANIGSSLMSSFVAVVIFYIFIRIAIEMVLILIGGRIILMGGIIMLGFAGSKWTMQFAERYFTTAINLGIKLLFIILIISVGETLAPTWSDIIKTAPKEGLMEAYMAVLGAAFVYFFLALRIPDMAANLLTGSFTMGFIQPVGTAIALGTAGAAYGTAGVITMAENAVRSSNNKSTLKEAAKTTFGQANIGKESATKTTNAITTLTNNMSGSTSDSISSNPAKKTMGPINKLSSDKKDVL